MKTKHSLTALDENQTFFDCFICGLALSTSVMAVTSAPTTTVKGHAPVYTAPTIGHTDTNNNNIIDVGDVLTETEGTFTDADGDTKTAPTWRWNDGTTDLGTGDSHTIVAGDLGKTIQLFATPNTDPSITDPAVGTEVGGGTAGAPGGPKGTRSAKFRLWQPSLNRVELTPPEAPQAASSIQQTSNTRHIFAQSLLSCRDRQAPHTFGGKSPACHQRQFCLSSVCLADCKAAQGRGAADARY